MSLYDLITNRKPTYVYMYTFSNGKQYIGISHDPARRLKAHIDRATLFPPTPLTECFSSCGQPSVKILYKYDSRQDAYDREAFEIEGRETLYPSGCNLSAGHGHKIVKYDSGYVLLGSAGAVDGLKRP